MEIESGGKALKRKKSRSDRGRTRLQSNENRQNGFGKVGKEKSIGCRGVLKTREA